MPEQKTTLTNEPLIVLQTLNNEVALPVSQVHRVVEISGDSLTPVPRSPNTVKGVINHWGRIVTVIDLGPLLGKGSLKISNDLLPLIILEHGQHQLGLLVNNIIEIVTSGAGQQLESKTKGIISLMVELKNRAVGIISIEQLLVSLKQSFEAAAKAI
jgi:chemotaxis signal transduction protein